MKVKLGLTDDAERNRLAQLLLRVASDEAERFEAAGLHLPDLARYLHWALQCGPAIDAAIDRTYEAMPERDRRQTTQRCLPVAAHEAVVARVRLLTLGWIWARMKANGDREFPKVDTTLPPIVITANNGAIIRLDFKRSDYAREHYEATIQQGQWPPNAELIERAQTAFARYLPWGGTVHETGDATRKRVDIYTN